MKNTPITNAHTPTSNHTKNGFTLAELLIVILLIGILATAAITSYMNSTKTFEFLSAYKNIKAAIATAHSYALAGKNIDSTTPGLYGVFFENNKITVFADTGETELLFDKDNDSDEDDDKIIKEYDFTSTDYTISVFGSSEPDIFTLPVALFYESGTGALTIKQAAEPEPTGTNSLISKKDEKYIVIKFTDGVSLTKYVYVMQASGLPEESDTFTAL